MRRVDVSKLQPGDVLGASIKIPSPHPSVLHRLRMESGKELNEEDIERLKEVNIRKITLKDSDTSDLDDYLHDDELRQAQTEVEQEFDEFTSKLDESSREIPDIGRLQSAVSGLIESLKNSEVMASFTSLKTQDSYTARHSMDVAKITLQLCIEFESRFRKVLKKESGASWKYINRHFLEDIGLGAMLHDIGKRHISEDILKKPDQLSDDEWNKMISHSQMGYEELSNMQSQINAPVKMPAYHHHEKFDGTGYPRGLEGNEIHLYGRLCACADVYSALTSKRPYRDAKTASEALRIMDVMQKEGPHFDPVIYDRFKKIVFPYPIGEEVNLSDGSSGVVCEVDADHPRQPTVRILSRDGERLRSPEEIVVKNKPGELQIVDFHRRTTCLVEL